MSVWWKIGAVAVAAAAFFMGGYKYAAALYEKDIASMIADYERRAKTVQENANAKLLSEREKNAQTTSELVAQIEDLSVRSREYAVRVDRLQRDLAARSKVSRAESDPCRACKERCSKCEELLSEGIGLVQEGRELSESISVRKDAIVKYLSSF